MKLTFLGTGTSHGIPVIGCDCDVCRSNDPHDKRYRSSVYIETKEKKFIQIDTGPEFRIQAIENNIKKIDAVLMTHAHADHLFGLDDLRIFSCDLGHIPEDPRSKKIVEAPPLPLYTNKSCINDISKRFDYIFSPSKEGGGHAKIALHEAKEAFYIGQTQIIPIPMMHGHLETTGWLLVEKNDDGEKQSIAYLTDCNYISEQSIELIKSNCGKLKHLIIDGLRIKAHSTHFNFLQALEVSEKIGGEKIWFTHLTHNESHKTITEYLTEQKKAFPGLAKAESLLPAYDKLVLEI